MSDGKSKRIRDLNDAFRKTGLGGKVVCTNGVFELGADKLVEIRKIVAEFDQFTPDNDPYGEHDFGSFELGGNKFFWKIDYYDADMTHGSSDASNPEITTRVLTIMLRDEY